MAVQRPQLSVSNTRRFDRLKRLIYPYRDFRNSINIYRLVNIRSSVGLDVLYSVIFYFMNRITNKTHRFRLASIDQGQRGQRQVCLFIMLGRYPHFTIDFMSNIEKSLTFKVHLYFKLSMCR